MSDNWLNQFKGQEVIIEIGDGFTVFGTLSDYTPTALIIEKADLHDQKEANSSRDIYALETSDLGIRVNRKRVFIPRERLIALSLLSDVAQ